MLSQDVVLVFLQASITGAGLILAIYALIIPISNRVFESNILDFLEALKYSKKIDNFLNNKPDKKSAEKAKSFAINFVQSWTFPTYLRFGVGATFFGYTITTLVSIAWVVDWQKPIVDSILVPSFIVSTLIFLFVGLISIKDIHKIMRQDFNDMIKSLRNNENET